MQSTAPRPLLKEQAKTKASRRTKSDFGSRGGVRCKAAGSEQSRHEKNGKALKLSTVGCLNYAH